MQHGSSGNVPSARIQTRCGSSRRRAARARHAAPRRSAGPAGAGTPASDASARRQPLAEVGQRPPVPGPGGRRARLVLDAVLGELERGRHVKIGWPCWTPTHPAGGERPAVADPLDVVDDRHPGRPAAGSTSAASAPPGPARWSARPRPAPGPRPGRRTRAGVVGGLTPRNRSPRAARGRAVRDEVVQGLLAGHDRRLGAVGLRCDPGRRHRAILAARGRTVRTNAGSASGVVVLAEAVHADEVRRPGRPRRGAGHDDHGVARLEPADRQDPRCRPDGPWRRSRSRSPTRNVSTPQLIASWLRTSGFGRERQQRDAGVQPGQPAHGVTGERRTPPASRRRQPLADVARGERQARRAGCAGRGSAAAPTSGPPRPPR